jgi:hypothetical protein
MLDIPEAAWVDIPAAGWYLVNVHTENTSRDTIPLTVLLKSTRNFCLLSAPPGNPKWCRLHAMQLKMAPFLCMRTEPLYQFYDGYITRTSGGVEEEGEEGVEHTYESLQDTTSIR